MRELNVNKLTETIKDMCIRANHFLSEDMKTALDTAEASEKSPLGKKSSASCRRICRLPEKR